MDRGGSRRTSPGGRDTWGGRAGGGEDWRRGAGPEYDEYTERGRSRGASPGGNSRKYFYDSRRSFIL